MYSLIDAKRSTRKLYTEALVGLGDITEADAEEMAKDFQVQLESIFNAVHNVEPQSDPHFKAPEVTAPESVTTSISESVARKIMATQTAVPENFTVHPKLMPQLQRRLAALDDATIDWAGGEALAFGSLLLDGHPIRLAGQDARRGTFSNRHAVIIEIN